MSDINMIVMVVLTVITFTRWGARKPTMIFRLHPYQAFYEWFIILLAISFLGWPLLVIAAVSFSVSTRWHLISNFFRTLKIDRNKK